MGFLALQCTLWEQADCHENRWQTGEVGAYQLTLGTKKFPVGVIPYVAHRSHAMPASIHIAVEGGHWWLSFASDDPDVTMPGRDVDAATEQIAEDLRHLSPNQLAERTLGGDRGVAKPLVMSDGQVFDLRPVQKSGMQKTRRHRQRWQRRAARRRKGSQNQKKAYRQAARYQQYEVNVRQEYAHQTSHALVVNAAYDLYVFESLPIKEYDHTSEGEKRRARPFSAQRGESQSWPQSGDSHLRVGAGRDVHTV